MKKYLHAILAVTIYFLFSNEVNAAYDVLNSDTTHYEAEAAKYDQLQKLSDSNASGREFLRMADKGTVEWKIIAPADQWYELKFRYRTFGGENEEYVVRNGYEYAVGFPGSKNWELFTTHTFLKSGINTIQIQKSWGKIDLDYLQVIPIDLNPELTPLKNIFYKEYPRDLVVKLNRFGNKIKNATCNGKEVPIIISDYKYYEDAVNVKIPASFISNLETGEHSIKINFDGGSVLTHQILVKEKGVKAGLTILVPYVEHGKSILFILPTGKTLLVDCGKAWVRDSLIIPFLLRNKITKIDYFILTHYHEDHDSGDRGEKIKTLFSVDHFYDYNLFHTGDSLAVEGVKIKILNSLADGDEENTRSLSFKLVYNGFVYVDGGDTYAINQQKIMKRFPNDIKADLFAANHHFHGSSDVEYLRAMNPSLVLIQSQEAIYARSTYMIDFLQSVKDYQNSIKPNSIEGLPAQEIGTTVIRVNDKTDFTYETYFDYEHCTIPYLSK